MKIKDMSNLDIKDLELEWRSRLEPSTETKPKAEVKPALKPKPVRPTIN